MEDLLPEAIHPIGGDVRRAIATVAIDHEAGKVVGSIITEHGSTFTLDQPLSLWVSDFSGQ